MFVFAPSRMGDAAGAIGAKFGGRGAVQKRGVHFRDYDRRTALHIAASEGHVTLCEYLLQAGAHVNRSDRWGGSPLNDAIRHRHADVVACLKQHGAKYGSPSQSTCFITAAAEGDLQEVRDLLEYGHNIDVNRGDYDSRTGQWIWLCVCV